MKKIERVFGHGGIVDKGTRYLGKSDITKGYNKKERAL